MNIFRTTAFRAIALSLALPLSAVLVGCEMGSVDSTSAVLSDNAGKIYNFAGLYMSPTNTSGSTNGLAPLVYPHGAGNHPSGQLIVSLRLLQYGEVLEAYDSAGLTWYGSITSVQSGSAQFSLRGRTSAGMSTEIAGTLTSDGSTTKPLATMDATWIEPAYYGSLFAQATVTPATTNTPPPVTGLSLTSDVASVSLGGTVHFTASGGTSSYTWPTTASFGTITSSGSSATYVRTSGTSSNSVTVTVTSGSESDNVTILFI